MKNALLVFAFAFLLMIGACSEKPEPDAERTQRLLLSKSWRVNSVLRDGVAQQGYSDFTLTIIDRSGTVGMEYNTTGRPSKSPWLGSGTFGFEEPVASTLLRDPGSADEIPVTYVVNDTQLQLTFRFTGAGFSASRPSSMGGEWTFNLSLH